jgi:DDE superfamily endonuclease
VDHQPRPGVPAKKGARDRLIRLAQRHPDWVLGFEDEVWWSRLARPELHAWAGDEPKRMHQPGAEAAGAGPKALACYGLLRADDGGMMVRFVDGRPVSQVTEDYLAWVCERLAKGGKRALLLVWDNASWHISKRVRSWIKGHNRRAKAEGGVRIVSCPLPVKAPWLNRIEPKWVHGKRAIVEPDRPLTAAEVVDRVCTYYGCEPLERIAQHHS